MTMTEFLANPMAPLAVISLIVFVGFIVALALADTSPTPEYVRIMAEHNARMAAFEADKPMRMAQYLLDSEERREKMKAEWDKRSAARHAEYLASKGE